jgi:hypothetical protein
MLGDSRHGAVCKLRRQVSLLRTGGIPEGRLEAWVGQMESVETAEGW